MQEQKIIKAIVGHICPHCSAEIMIAHRIVMPNIDWILKREDLAAAKKNLLTKLENVPFADQKEKEDIINWVNMEDNIFGPAEVEGIMAQIMNNSKLKEVPKEEKFTEYDPKVTADLLDKAKTVIEKRSAKKK